MKPLEEEVVPLTGATIDVRNLRGQIRVYEDSYGLCTGMGSITLKCNSLHYNYFGKMCHYITLQLLYFVNVINYITVTLSK